MLLSDLDYEFPPELIATKPSRPSRVCFVAPGSTEPEELTIPELLKRFEPGDLLVVNESRVVPARVFSDRGAEVLFLAAQGETTWQVLFPARDYKVGDTLNMPGGLSLKLIEKGIPQRVETSRPIDHAYLEQNGEFALPPYIQQARGERHNTTEDANWYQTAWAAVPGSTAAPTASLHFTQNDLEHLRARGVNVAKLVLHVGAGTFLPIRTNDLDAHEMHAETVHIPNATLDAIEAAKARGKRVWGLGTTVTRALESIPAGLLTRNSQGYSGETRLFIRPGFQYQVIDVLLTNFHQPRTTLMALVAAFTSLERTKQVYAWAVAKKFRLFSYGDLSVWIKP